MCVYLLFQLLFAFIPPPTIWGGWLCFLVSLAFIGALTAIIGDLASILGCLIGLKDQVTAITLVALGKLGQICWTLHLLSILFILQLFVLSCFLSCVLSLYSSYCWHYETSRLE